MQPLAGLRILDFSSPLPGPLARLFRAEAGAEVIKIECPGTSEPATYFVARPQPERRWCQRYRCRSRRHSATGRVQSPLRRSASTTISSQHGC